MVAGLAARGSGAGVGGRSAKLTPGQVPKEARRLYDDAELTVEQIGKVVGGSAVLPCRDGFGSMRSSAPSGAQRPLRSRSEPLLYGGPGGSVKGVRFG